MIAVPLYASGYPCKCNGSCNYSKAYEEAGMPRYIDYEKYIKKNFVAETKQDLLVDAYLKTKYCLNK